MSGALSPTTAGAPSTVQTAANVITLMTAETNVPTDFNSGSNVRTLSEAIGAVLEIQAVTDQALAMQALVYGAMSLFGIQQAQAQPASGIATFATSFPLGSALPTTQAVVIPSGTLVQTAGGVQFATLSAVTLASGTVSVQAGIIASLPGSAGNVAASGITGTPLTSIGYPLYVTNAVATAGGADAGSQSSALALFTAKVKSLGNSTPVAVANSPIGIAVSGTGESVQFAACFEPWIFAGSGVGSGTAGFTIYIDNGTGGASNALISAVAAAAPGNPAIGLPGFAPAGVPYSVSAVTPVFATVIASGTLFQGLISSGNVAAAAVSGVQNYFNTIGVSAPSGTSYSSGVTTNIASQSQIAGVIADAGFGAFATLNVYLFYTSASGSPVTVVSGGVGTRVILSSLNVNIQPVVAP
jgi:Baseplate J-like protein